MIKKIWITQFYSGSDRSNICIRFEPKTPIHAQLNDFPPLEPIDGKRLDITQAHAQGLAEPHLVLGAFSPAEVDDLITKLQDIRSLMP